jgi:hypothetical protein
MDVAIHVVMIRSNVPGFYSASLFFLPCPFFEGKHFAKTRLLVFLILTFCEHFVTLASLHFLNQHNIYNLFKTNSSLGTGPFLKSFTKN